MTSPASVIGVLTPQANTTVEPEFWCLLPPDWSLLNARLTSTGGDVEARLRDYAQNLEERCEQFANAPLRSIAFACTGSSYLIGHEQEEALVNELSDRHGRTLVTAARAVREALGVLGARRISLVSPYPASLTRAAVRYWESVGLEIVAIQGAAVAGDSFHPIYAMSPQASSLAVRALADQPGDAIVLLGTGMPTLATLAEPRAAGAAPVLSVNLALAWAACGGESGPVTLPAWLDGGHWLPRYRLLFPAAG